MLFHIHYISIGIVILLLGGRGAFKGSLGGMCRRGFQTLTLFKTKSVHFNTLFKTIDLYILLVFCVFALCLPCFSFTIQEIFFYINDILG